MSYAVKEIYYTLQGEGANVGRPAVFLRFAGCNLWSGREEDRPTATCRFCDTDFVGTDGPGGGRFASAQALARAVVAAWPDPAPARARPFVETNGTLPAPPGIDWICVSPKAGADLVLQGGNELKLVFPQDGAEPERFESLGFQHFFLQPMDGSERARNTALAVRYCLAHPQWRLSLQTHKLLGIP